MPPGEYQQSYEPPYGQQYHDNGGPRGQEYGPQVMKQAGQVSQLSSTQGVCLASARPVEALTPMTAGNGKKKALLVRYMFILIEVLMISRLESTTSALQTSSKAVSTTPSTGRASSAVRALSHSLPSFELIGEERFGYDPTEIVLLTDNTNDERSFPTRANIIRAMQWLMDGAQRDESLFFH